MGVASGQQSTQLLDYGSGALPDCAHQCTPLQQAQGACVPPAAPTSSDYTTCFCQSNFLQTFYGSQSGVCDSACPSDGLGQIRSWFTSYCKQPQATTSSTTPSSTKSPAASNTAAAASIAAASSNPAASGTSAGVSWWNNHWRYVLMLIVIFLVLGGAAAGGIWYRRRRKRRAAAVVAAPIAWGPHQHQHYTQGHAAYNANPEKRVRTMRGPDGPKGKGKEKARLSAADPDSIQAPAKM
ncbi:MAG: hypothetical protein M1838_000966 [Thelocarpon superellum]|nr:MAG: hypothetical protein M1838_000966 [Thelocarpon superellum]